MKDNTKIKPMEVDPLRDLIHSQPDAREVTWELDLNDLYAANGKYTPEEKLYAVVAYMVEGNSVRASKRTGIPADTIRWWKNNAPWWNDAMKEGRRQYQDQLDAHLTRIIHKGAEEVAERLEKGDEIVTKDGDVRRKKMAGRDVATTMAILYDKRALLRGDPTSNPGRGGQALDALAKRFEEFADKLENSGKLAKPIEAKRMTAADFITVDDEENGE